MLNGGSLLNSLMWNCKGFVALNYSTARNYVPMFYSPPPCVQTTAPCTTCARRSNVATAKSHVWIYRVKVLR